MDEVTYDLECLDYVVSVGNFRESVPLKDHSWTSAVLEGVRRIMVTIGMKSGTVEVVNGTIELQALNFFEQFEVSVKCPKPEVTLTPWHLYHSVET